MDSLVLVEAQMTLGAVANLTIAEIRGSSPPKEFDGSLCSVDGFRTGVLITNHNHNENRAVADLTYPKARLFLLWKCAVFVVGGSKQ